MSENNGETPTGASLLFGQVSCLSFECSGADSVYEVPAGNDVFSGTFPYILTHAVAQCAERLVDCVRILEFLIVVAFKRCKEEICCPKNVKCFGFKALVYAYCPQTDKFLHL